MTIKIAKLASPDDDEEAQLATKQPKDGERLLGTHVAAKTKHHHLDKRAAKLAAEPGSDDELLTTPQLASWLGTSTQWVELARCTGVGPPFEKLGARSVRYRRDKVRAWLDQRSHASTAEYRKARA